MHSRDLRALELVLRRPGARLLAAAARCFPEAADQLIPVIRQALAAPPDLVCASAAFDAVLLFAVLTCVPDNEAQQAVVAELSRALPPGGLLYVSGLVLQDDRRSRDRYAAHAQRSATP
ncbi:methyltransferase domain-containing protein [Streptomyces sp. NPDC001068]|uniref:methyltransferase domain-containing protein n=1 Tax=Streptomyces sp. NPDC001068 TaxID=3364544 RepID=UPI003673AE8B